MSKAALLEELPASHWSVCTLKRAVLVLFVLQTTSYVLLIRYSKTRLAGSSTPFSSANLAPGTWSLKPEA